jgi:hypothetical protein
VLGQAKSAMVRGKGVISARGCVVYRLCSERGSGNDATQRRETGWPFSRGQGERPEELRAQRSGGRSVASLRQTAGLRPTPRAAR